MEYIDCPQCNKLYDEHEYEYCPHCSFGYWDGEDDDDTSIILICPQCGAETTDEEELFCPECGHGWHEDFDSDDDLDPDGEDYNSDGSTPLHW